MKIEAYAWNDHDDARQIQINTFDDIEKARTWLRNRKATNKILATSPEEISKTRTYLWGGK